MGLVLSLNVQPHNLICGSTFIYFFEACTTKGYVVNSCLAPPLNPDSEAVSHSATSSVEVRKILTVRTEPMLSGFLTLNAESILPQVGNK